MRKQAHISINKLAIYSFLHKCRIISDKIYKKRTEKHQKRLYDALSEHFGQTLVQGIPDVVDRHPSARAKIGILTTWATLYIAKLIAEVLRRFNIAVQIDMSFDKDKHEEDGMFYFVLTPMEFKKGLPDNYVAIQMEQTISERWFTDQYITKLNNAKSVLDYSLRNIGYLMNKRIGSSNLFYTPISPLPNYTLIETERETDVLFYGDDRCERRASLLNALSSQVNLKRAFCVYGTKMMEELNNAKIVVNIHYYEGAMLETTRICEALSHGCLVVSENSINDSEYPELCELIDLVPTGDANALAERLNFWLTHPELRKKKLQEIRKKVNKLFSQFCYSIGRVLFYHGVIGFDSLYHGTKDSFISTNKICIGSLDTGCDEAVLETLKESGFLQLPPLKLPKKGSGKIASYCYASRLALKNGFKHLILSDGALNPCHQFSNKFSEIEKDSPQIGQGDIVILGESSEFGQDNAANISSSELINPAMAIFGENVLRRLAYGVPSESLRNETIAAWLSRFQRGVIVTKHPSILSTAALPLRQKELKENPCVHELPKVEVSIIVPCYNQGLYLRDCLRSILAQTFTNYEVIIVNDGSDDNSWSIISEFVEKYPNRIKGINQSNSGVVAARNNAITLAKGKYIFPLDGDDLIAPSCLEKLYAAMEAHLGDVVYSQTEFFGTSVGLFKLPLPTREIMPQGNCVVCSALYKKSDWSKYGGYDEHCKNGYEDWCFWLNFVVDDKKFYRLDETLFYYRQNIKSRNVDAINKSIEIKNYFKKKFYQLYS